MPMAVSVKLMSCLGLAREQVDVIVALCSCREEHSMWMEGRGRDGGAAVRVDPSRIRLDGRELLPFKVEDLDGVFRGSAIAALACFIKRE